MALTMAMTPEHERPRERMLARGAEALSERELLALLLRHGTRGASATDVAGQLLADYGSLRSLASARPEELAARVGIGVAKATAVVAAFELGRRVDVDHEPVILVRGPDDVARVARIELCGLRRERVIVLVCDGANRLQRTITVSEGSVDKSLFPVREILNAVIRHDGRAFAIAHNHPSTDAKPSAADRRATADMAAGASVVGLRFLGHIVIGVDDYSAILK